jgi:hypothetical protein
VYFPDEKSALFEAMHNTLQGLALKPWQNQGFPPPVRLQGLRIKFFPTSNRLDFFLTFFVKKKSKESSFDGKGTQHICSYE